MLSVLTDKLQGKAIEKNGKQYVLNQLLTAGQFGHIYQGLDVQSNQTIAIKVIPKVLLNQYKQLAKLIPNEIKALKVCNSKNVLRYIDDHQTQNNFYIMTEYCKDGNLYDYVMEKKRLDERTATEFFCQVLQGMMELHKNKIAHRDIKAQNIFLHQGVLKLADFGFAKMYNLPENDDNVDVFQTALGTPCYMAPEVLLCKPYSIKADIYSLGVLFYFMLFSKFPYYYANNDYDDTDLAKQIESKPLIVETKQVKISKAAKDLLQRTIVYDPKKRLSFSELYEHAVVQSILQNDKPLGDGRNGLDVDIHKSHQYYQQFEQYPYQNEVDQEQVQLLDNPEDLRPMNQQYLQQINQNEQILNEAQQFVNKVCKQEINKLNFTSKTIFTIAKYKNAEEDKNTTTFLCYNFMLHKLCLKWADLNKGFLSQKNIFNAPNFDRFKQNDAYNNFMNNVLNSYYPIIETHLATDVQDFIMAMSSVKSSTIQSMISKQNEEYEQMLNSWILELFLNSKNQIDQANKKQMKLIWRLAVCLKINQLFINNDITQYLDQVKQQVNQKGWKTFFVNEIKKIEI